MRENINKHKQTRNIKTTATFLTQYAKLSSFICGKIHDTHSFTFTADILGPNSDILNHNDDMKAMHSDRLSESKVGEMETMLKNIHHI